MTLDRLKASGRGRLHIRIVIEGLSVEVVTDRAMQQTLADGRVRCVGLDPKGIELGARADLRAARIEAQGFELKVNDVSARVPGSRHGTITRELWQRPSASTFLSAPAGPTDTTLTVYDTSTFAASGVVHVGTEAISYTGKTSTTLTGCTRAAWDTRPGGCRRAAGTRASARRSSETSSTRRARQFWSFCNTSVCTRAPHD